MLHLLLLSSRMNKHWVSSMTNFWTIYRQNVCTIMYSVCTGLVDEECDFTPQFMNIRHYYSARVDDSSDNGILMVSSASQYGGRNKIILQKSPLDWMKSQWHQILLNRIITKQRRKLSIYAISYPSHVAIAQRIKSIQAC